MKIHCKNIDAIPSIESIIDVTQQEHLVLEFPKATINPAIESQLIADFKKQLPENYSIFNSGIWESTITITIKSLVSASTINPKIEFVIQGLKDYLDISRMLLNADPTNTFKDWELMEEHGEHNRYENIQTGQILETCSFPMTHFNHIDPYFWGLFIKTSTNHQDLKEMIKSEFHNALRILDFVEKHHEFKKQITLYMKL